MKKVLFTVLLFFSMIISAQTSITPSVVTDDKTSLFKFKEGYFAYMDGSTYLILPYDGVQKKDLFHKVLLALNDVYSDIDQVVTKIEYDAITINSKYILDEPMGWHINKKRLDIYSFLYRLSFKFKDGKIRIDAPSVSKLECNFENNGNQLYNFEIFKKETIIALALQLRVDKVIKQIFKNIYSSDNNNW